MATRIKRIADSRTTKKTTSGQIVKVCVIAGRPMLNLMYGMEIEGFYLKMNHVLV